MAELNDTNPTLLDVLGRTGTDGNIAAIGEMLHQTNEILLDLTSMEGNTTTGNESVIRTGLPEPTWRKLYGSVADAKSTTARITDTCGSLQAYAEIDKDLADLNGNSAAFRLSESRAHIEGFNQKLSRYLFLGNEATEPEAITGFGPRFNSTTAENGENIVLADSGASGSDQTSIWLVVWSPETVFTFYPKGSKAGLSRTDKGVETVRTSDGKYEAYVEHFKWDIGLCVKNWQYVVRIANVDRSALKADAATGTDIVDAMTQASEIIPALSMGRAAFYCNRTVRSFLRRQMVAKVKQSTLTFDTVAGKRVFAFDEIPVRRCDQITNTEAAVS